MFPPRKSQLTDHRSYHMFIMGNFVKKKKPKPIKNKKITESNSDFLINNKNKQTSKIRLIIHQILHRKVANLQIHRHKDQFVELILRYK